MSVAEPARTEPPRKRMTVAEFLQFEDDPDKHYELIDGELWEEDVTTRSLKHSICMARITTALQNWRDRQPSCPGIVAAGEVRCHLRPDAETVVGIDVAVFTGTWTEAELEQTSHFSGPPLLAVEILSPSDTQERVFKKVHDYLQAGTAVIWLIDPDWRTVTVIKPEEEPVLFNRTQRIANDPQFPGLDLAVDTLFSYS